MTGARLAVALRRLGGRNLAALVVSLIGLGLVTTALAPAASADPAPGATFNVPAPWGDTESKYRIVRKIENAIRDTPAQVSGQEKPVIFVTSYLLDRKISVEALIDACKRGVSVRVIIDAGIDTAIAKRLARTLNADNVTGPSDPPDAGPCNTNLANGQRRQMSDEEVVESVRLPDVPVTWGRDASYVKICRGACRGGDKGTMHTKIYGFSKVGNTENVVMVSSANLNIGGAVLGWNDLYTVVGRADMFNEYKRVHRLMTDEVRAAGGLEEFSNGPFLSRFFPFLGARKDRDPVMNDLNRVQCRGGADGPTELHVSMFFWKNARGAWIADKLGALGRAGCDVNVIVGAPSNKLMAKLRTLRRSGAIKLWDSRWNLDGVPQPEVRTHGKFLLIKGNYRGDNNAKVVLTGSQNWTNGALWIGDENTLTINVPSVYTDYRSNWQVIRAHSRPA